MVSPMKPMNAFARYLLDEWQATDQPLAGPNPNVIPLGDYADGSVHMAWPEVLGVPSFKRMYDRGPQWDASSPEGQAHALDALGVGGSLALGGVGASAGARVAREAVPTAPSGPFRGRAYRGTVDPLEQDLAARRDNGLYWAAQDRDLANVYAQDAFDIRKDGGMAATPKDAQSPSVTPVDLDFANPLYIDGTKSDWYNIPFDGGQYSTGDIARIAQQRGHDGVVFNNIPDAGLPRGTQFAAVAPNTVRSATTGETLFSNPKEAAGIQAGLTLTELPMDQASRLARAREMGFDLEAPLFRGMDSAPHGNEYRLSEDGSLGPAVYLTPDQKHAAKFGDVVQENYVRGKIANIKDAPSDVVDRPFWRDFLGLDGTPARRAADWARDNGYAGLQQDGYQTAIFDPRSIRSVNAAFDPAKSDSANLLAANPPTASIPSLAIGQGDDDQFLDALLARYGVN